MSDLKDFRRTPKVMSDHIIPSANAQYDLGNAEYKIRHLFLSDNSLWIGDDHKIDIHQEGKIRFRKRSKTDLPAGLRDIVGIAFDEHVPLHQLYDLAEQHGVSPEALWGEDDFEEQELGGPKFAQIFSIHEAGDHGLDVSHQIVHVSVAASVTLPDDLTAQESGKKFYVKNVSADPSLSVSVNCPSALSLEGLVGNQISLAQYDSLTVLWDGSQYWKHSN